MGEVSRLLYVAAPSLNVSQIRELHQQRFSVIAPPLPLPLPCRSHATARACHALARSPRHYPLPCPHPLPVSNPPPPTTHSPPPTTPPPIPILIPLAGDDQGPIHARDAGASTPPSLPLGASAPPCGCLYPSPRAASPTSLRPSTCTSAAARRSTRAICSRPSRTTGWSNGRLGEAMAGLNGLLSQHPKAWGGPPHS